MLRKYIAVVLLGVLFAGHMLQIFPTSAVTTDGTAANWTREKAEHLARRVLFYPTPQKVDELYQAGSASAAVDNLFPDEVGPDRSAYDADMASFAGGAQYQSYFGTGNFGWNTDAGNMYRYYLYRYYRDPYEAKAKLSTLFEDIYSVNSFPTGIEFTDIIHLHDLLYKHTLGNYKTLVKRTLLNNPTDQGDYAASEFLNLLRQWNYNNPNENYPREMLQLFLMGEYLPLESKDNGDERNYSEEDVASLARIITGFYGGYPHTAYADDITVFFTGAYHNKSNGITFLPGNTGGVNYPFYDANTDTLDLSGMMLPVLGNNGLGDNTVDYIFSKRSHAIALFLANKLYNFYIGENPTHTELDAIASTLETNDFEMLPTIKWMLVQDFFYSDTSMNAVLYYSPLELVIGLFRTLHAADATTFDTNFFAYNDLLSRLSWTPYFPGSIFGRDGYDANYKWFSAYTATQWSNLVTTVSYDLTRTGAYQIPNIVPITQSGGTDITMDDFISQVEDNLILSRPLPLSVKNSIKSYLTTSETGATISFQPNNTAYRDVKFPGVFALVLSSPEFVLKSGYDQPTSSDVTSESKIENASGTLIVVELPGGYDWLNGIIEKSDYTSYANLRTDGSGNTIAQPLGNLVDLGDFYMNPYIAYSGGVQANGSGMKQVYDAGYLRIFNRVGTPEHSRDHNQAQNQSTSFDNTVMGRMGLLGALAQYETNSSNLYVMGTKRPNILQGGTYVNLGASDNRFSNSNPKGKLNTNQRNQQAAFLMGSMTGRLYPGNVGDRYNESIKIHTIANLSVAQGGSAGVGYTTSSQLTFAKTLLDNNEGKIFYLQNNGNGYDTHSNELSGSTNLDIGIGKATSDIVKFFESVKSTHNVTIVMYSEFGRTNLVNGTIGTDHGQGGGLFVLSNNSDILSSWTGGVYGKIQTSLERSDWLTTGIDYRTVYSKIIDALYGIPEGSFFPDFSRTFDDEISVEPTDLPLMHTVYQGASDTKVIPVIKFQASGRNFDVNKGSYFMSSFSTGAGWVNNTSPFASKKSENYSRIKQGTDGFYKMDINDKIGYQGVAELQPYDYSINPVTNQYVSHIYSGTIVLPEVISSGINTVSTGSNSVLRRYNNITVTSTGGYIPSGSGIILASNMSGSTIFAPGNGIQMVAGTGVTYITSLTSSGVSQKWNGGFIIGERMDTPGFLPEDARLIEDGLSLSGFVMTDVVRVGADVLGIGMHLSQPVELTLTGATPNAQYYILTSEDGHNWSRHSYTPVTADASGVVTFPTDHFSLFTLALVPNVPLCSFSADQTTVVDGTSVNFTWSTLGADTVDISPTIGSVGFSGMTSIIPPSGTSTNYTLSATNAQGTGTCHVIVQSLSLPTCSITPSVPSAKNGAQVYLTWTGTNALTAVLNPGARSVPPSGNIALIPPQNTTTNYTLSVSNSVGSGSCMTSVSTYANTAPVANSDGVNILENTSKVFDILSNDTDTDSGDTLTVASFVSNPVHGSAEISGTGILYTGTGGYCGTDTFSYRAQDQDGAISNTATVNVSISCGLNPPVLSGSIFSLDEDTNISDQISGSDIDGDTLTYSIVTSPIHGSLNLLSDGSFFYTPISNYYGTDSFTAKANDGGFDSNTATFTIHVNSVNDIPVTSADSGSTNMDSPTFIDVLANDFDIDHDPAFLAINITTSPMSGSLVQTGGMLEYTPTAGYCGTDAFAYSVTDGSGGTSNIASVDMDILCVSGAPVATYDTALGVEDTTLNIDFISNDTDPDFATGADSISFHDFVTLPAHGTVTVTTSGSATPNRSNEIFTYTPTADYCGTDTFTYRVHDAISTISSTAFVSITLSCSSDAPIVPNMINRSGYSDVAYTGVLTATDIDSSSFTYQMVNPTSLFYGTASISSTGFYVYTPLPYSGSIIDNLYYTAIDGSGAISNTGVIIFSLTEAPVVYTYTGTDISSTGSAQIFTGVTLEQNDILDLNGNSIAATSDSGSTGSIVLPGTLDILVESGMWSGEILAPSILPANDTRNITLTDAGVSPVLPASTPTMTYTYIPADTFKAGSEDAALSLTGGYADIEFVVDTPGVVFGSRLQLLRSQDGVTWEANYPDASCIVDNELKCTFRTNHLTYFGTVQQIASPVVQVFSSVSGPGGYYSAPPVNPVPPGLILGGTGYTTTGGLLPGYSVKSQAYIDWVKKYQERYAEKYLAEKVYWDILKKNDTVDERTEAVDTAIIDLMDTDESLFDIALMISDMWEAKLAWKEKLKLIQ